MTEDGTPIDRAESRMQKADAAIDRKALDAIAKDMGLHDGANRDAALGLPLVMTGPDSTRTLDNLTKWGVVLWHDADMEQWEYRSSGGAFYWSPDLDKWMVQNNPEYGFDTRGVIEANPPTIPPPDWNNGTTPGPTPSRKDAASLSTKPDTYGEVLAREFDAYAEVFNLMTTKAQIDALIKYADAVSASRAARGEIVKGAQ